MDRTLNGDDLRLLDQWARESQTPEAREHSHRAPAPALDTLPGWFQQVVREQCIWLGIEIPGEAPVAASVAEPPAGQPEGRRAA